MWSKPDKRSWFALNFIYLDFDFEIRKGRESYWKSRKTYVTVAKKEFKKSCGFILTDDNRMERKWFIKNISNDELARIGRMILINNIFFKK